MNMLAWMQFLLKSWNLLGMKFNSPTNQHSKAVGV